MWYGPLEQLASAPSSTLKEPRVSGNLLASQQAKLARLEQVSEGGRGEGLVSARVHACVHVIMHACVSE